MKKTILTSIALLCIILVNIVYNKNPYIAFPVSIIFGFLFGVLLRKLLHLRKQ